MVKTYARPSVDTILSRILGVSTPPFLMPLSMRSCQRAVKIYFSLARMNWKERGQLTKRYYPQVLRAQIIVPDDYPIYGSKPCLFQSLVNFVSVIDQPHHNEPFGRVKRVCNPPVSNSQLEAVLEFGVKWDWGKGIEVLRQPLDTFHDLKSCSFVEFRKIAFADRS